VGTFAALVSTKRGVKPNAHHPLEPKLRQLEVQVTRLERELDKAHTILAPNCSVQN